MEAYRQGDVLLTAVASIPPRAEGVRRDRGRVVLAYGEATGHAHAITDAGAELLQDPLTGDLFVRVDDPGGAALAHEEHATITLPPGAYRVVRQREYLPDDRAHLVSD
jgi:hypothetical protein